MRSKHICLAALLPLQFWGVTQAQELLTLQEAVRLALQNNYDIRIPANNLEINRNDVTLGNAGFLPVVGAEFSNTNSIENTRQDRTDGTVREGNGVKSSGTRYGVALDWTVFNGFKMFTRYEQLKTLRDLGEENLRLAMLTQTADVVTLYYDLAQQQQQLQSYDTILAISRLRVNLAQARFEIGRASRLEVLNARVDYNTDTTNLVRQQAIYSNTRTQLNEQLARNPDIAFRVVDTFTIDTTLVLDELYARAATQNPTIQVALINKRIAELEAKLTRGDRYPVVGLQAGYNFLNNRSALGFATRSRGNGFEYGVTASFNLFNGFNRRRNEENARLLVNTSELEYTRTSLSVQAQLTRFYQNYRTGLALVEIEADNLALAARNLEITLDKFRLGSISTVEFRTAQVNYINAVTRLNTARYEAKLAEIFLREISGTLVLE